MRRPQVAENRNFYEAVGRRITARRTGVMTQEVLASKTSLTRTSINNIEKGRQQILLHTLVAIATALNVAPVELIPETDAIDVLLRDNPKAQAWVKTASSR